MSRLLTYLLIARVHSIKKTYIQKVKENIKNKTYF